MENNIVEHCTYSKLFLRHCHPRSLVSNRTIVFLQCILVCHLDHLVDTGTYYLGRQLLYSLLHPIDLDNHDIHRNETLPECTRHSHNGIDLRDMGGNLYKKTFILHINENIA